ncbi:hypothetical protein SDC9_85415 [bioreactor metagenome]|uniref:Uncharacterized protein n=1 Tax=bioreactor metagenome TaxID=1076179 RepID=A0A644ZD21_9ZZZZ
MSEVTIYLFLFAIFVLSCLIEFYARRNKSRIYFFISAFVSLIPLFLLLFYYDQNQILKYFVLTVFALNAISSLYKFFYFSRIYE